jgi:hypothetical protein
MNPEVKNDFGLGPASYAKNPALKNKYFTENLENLRKLRNADLSDKCSICVQVWDTLERSLDVSLKERLIKLPRISSMVGS